MKPINFILISLLLPVSVLGQAGKLSPSQQNEKLTDTIAPGKMKRMTTESNMVKFSISGYSDTCGKISIKYNDFPYLQQYQLNKDVEKINLKLAKGSNTIIIRAEAYKSLDSFAGSIQIDDEINTYNIYSMFRKGKSNFIFINRK